MAAHGSFDDAPPGAMASARSARRRAGVALGALVLGLTAVAACGRGGSDGTGDNAGKKVDLSRPVTVEMIGAAADATTGARTGRFSVDDAISMQGGAGAGSRGSGPSSISFTVGMKGEGTYDVSNKKLSLTATVDASGPDAIGAQGAMPNSVELIVDGDAAYMRTSGSRSDGRWTKTSGSGTSALFGSLGFGGLTGNDSTSPASMLAALRSLGGPVEDLGAADVRGVQTRHVRVTVSWLDLMRAQQRTSGRTAAGPDPFAGSDGFDKVTVPVDVYIDADGFVRRMATSVELDSAALGPSSKRGAALGGDDSFAMKTTGTIDLWDFGTDVTIRPPATSDVDEPHTKFSAVGRAISGDDPPGETCTTSTMAGGRYAQYNCSTSRAAGGSGGRRSTSPATASATGGAGG